MLKDVSMAWYSYYSAPLLLRRALLNVQVIALSHSFPDIFALIFSYDYDRIPHAVVSGGEGFASFSALLCGVDRLVFSCQQTPREQMIVVVRGDLGRRLGVAVDFP